MWKENSSRLFSAVCAIGLFLFLVFPGNHLSAQHAQLSDVELPFSTRINCIVQDENFKLYFGTTAGIWTYDGDKFHRIESGADQHIRSMAYLPGTTSVFAGSESGFLYEMPTDTEELKLIDSSSAAISKIALRGSTIFVSTYGDGLFMHDSEGTRDSLCNHMLPSPFVYDMLLLEENLLLASDAGLYLYRDQNCELLENTPDVIITELCLTEDGIWGTTFDKFIFHYNLSERKSTSYAIPDSSKVLFLEDYDGRPVLGTEKRVYILKDGGEFQEIRTAEGRAEAGRCFYVDSEEQVWLAMQDEGLYRSNSQVKWLQVPEMPPIQCLTKFEEKLVFGTENGLFYYDMNSKKTERISKGNIISLDSDVNHLFVGTYTSGLQVYGRNKKLLEQYDEGHGLEDNSILAIEKEDGDIIISTLSGMYRIEHPENNGKVEEFRDDLKNSYVMNISSRGGGDYVFGLDRDGLITIRDDETVHFSTYRGEKLGSFYAMANSGDELFLGSSDYGLLWMDENDLYAYEHLNNKSVNLSGLSGESIEEEITAIIPRQDSSLYLISKKGVDLLNRKDSSLLSLYTHHDSDEIELYHNNYVIDSNKAIAVFGDDCMVLNLKDELRIRTPEVKIHKIERDLETVLSGENVFIGGNNNFKFYFTTQSLRDKNNLTYEYNLNGLDTEWRRTRDKEAYFMNLLPGEYSFQVRGSYRPGVDYISSDRYDFEVKRKFYNTLWFRLLLLAIAASLIYFFYKRRQQIERLKEDMEKSKLRVELNNLKSQLNPHFLFNSFNTLSGLIDISTERSQNYLHYMSDFYRGVLEWNEEELIPLKDELKLLSLYEKIIVERFQNRVSISVPEVQEDLFIPPLSTQLLVENAVKHNKATKETPLKINITLEGKNLIIRNQLNLRPAQKFKTGYGLKNLKERFQLLNLGEVKVQDDSEEFIVILPLKSDI